MILKSAYSLQGAGEVWVNVPTIKALPNISLKEEGNPSFAYSSFAMSQPLFLADSMFTPELLMPRLFWCPSVSLAPLFNQSPSPSSWTESLGAGIRDGEEDTRDRVLCQSVSPILQPHGGWSQVLILLPTPLPNHSLLPCPSSSYLYFSASSYLSVSQEHQTSE